MTKKNLSRLALMTAFVVVLVFHQAVPAQAAFGDPDPAFGFLKSGGINDISLQYTPVSIARQADGKILIVGTSYNRVRLTRYLP
jgi:hypothetical protein